MSLLLDHVRMLMADNGTLYLTTNNVRSLTWQAMWDGTAAHLENDDHICWFDINTLKVLLKRSKLRIMRIFYCNNEQDKKFCKRHKVEWHSSYGRRIYLIIKKV